MKTRNPVPKEWDIEKRIQLYLEAIESGWSQHYAQSISGLKMGSSWQIVAKEDARVIAAHLKLKKMRNEKQRGKITG
jgi:hypothetical protein